MLTCSNFDAKCKNARKCNLILRFKEDFTLKRMLNFTCKIKFLVIGKSKIKGQHYIVLQNKHASNYCKHSCIKRSFVRKITNSFQKEVQLMQNLITTNQLMDYWLVIWVFTARFFQGHFLCAPHKITKATTINKRLIVLN